MRTCAFGRRSGVHLGTDSAGIGGVYRPGEKGVSSRFFKTGKGQYGEGDKFLGVVVPNTRQVAKQHKHEPFGVMATLLQSEWHECRFVPC